jgi:hypothetical protein
MVDGRSHLLLNIDGRDAWIHEEQKPFLVNRGFVSIHDPREDYFQSAEIEGKTFINVTNDTFIFVLYLTLRDLDFEKDLESKANGIVRPKILKLAQETLLDNFS